MTRALYDAIGQTYDTTRGPDPEIIRTLLQLLLPISQGRYLDVACGSGNYTDVLAQNGLQMEGIESGKIQEVIRDFENDIGDYLFVVGEKDHH